MQNLIPTGPLGHRAIERTLPYSPYGFRTVQGRFSALLGFNGEYQDQVLNGYILGNGYRAYNPGMMRFHAPDSVSPFGKGGINSYGYCAGDPINFADPSGHLAPLKGRAVNALPHQTMRPRRRSLTSDFEFLAVQQETAGAAHQMAQAEQANTLLRELRERVQPRPPVAGSAEATPYASMESLASSQSNSFTDLPAAVLMPGPTSTPIATEVMPASEQARALRANFSRTRHFSF